MHWKAEPGVRDIMTGSPVTLQKDDKLSLAEEVMTGGRIRHVPILDGERLVGVLSQADLFHSAFKALHFRPSEQRRFVNALKIEDVMSKHVVSVPTDTSIRAAARLMMEKKLGCLPIVEGDRLVGLVTKGDMLRCLAERTDEQSPVLLDIVC
jgi:CBS domain-containing protein